MITYEMCAQCSHFIGDNPAYGDYPGLAPYDHFDDGEKEHDHDATPSGKIHTLDEWRDINPDLFRTYPDQKIGPNSKYFKDGDR